MNEMTINFNGQNYIAKYNTQTGYYEVDLEAPQQGGIYNTDITFTDLLGQIYEDTQIIQIWAKEKITVETNTVTMWIFDYKDFEVKDIVEIADYEINVDEETNANSIIKVLKKTTAKSRDLVMIKKNNEVVYWGTIDKIQNEDGKKLYEYTLKYITNIFDEEVALNQNVSDNNIEDGIYRIKSSIDTNKVLDVKDGSMNNNVNVQLWGSNDTEAQKWNIEKQSDGYYSIISLRSGKALDVTNEEFTSGTKLQQYTYDGGNAQKWKIEYIGNSLYEIKSKGNTNLNVDVTNGSSTEGTIMQIFTDNNTSSQRFYLERLKEYIIRNVGIEDFIAKAIEENFTNSQDTFINREYLDVRVKTHTTIQTSVTNVTDGLYNLHTWMTNCTQLYNIMFTFYIENKKLVMEIENKSLNKELIDVNAQPISEYTEVFSTDVVSKVEVLTSTDTYYLYLLNDRTTTTDATNVNRAEGKNERVFTANYEDAEQKALDTIKSNTYNHNITFKYLNRIMKVGTPITIKTKESLIYDTYISSIKLTQNKFIEYTCGNIRIKFIDKLLKERRNK